MKKTTLFLNSVAIIFLTSCAGYNSATTKTSFKKLTNYSCKVRQKNVFLFFEGDSVNFIYKSLGFVELTCKEVKDEKEAKDRLKLLAYQNCSNAIVGIKTQTLTRNYGNGYRTGSKTYVAKTYEGVCVRIASDSLYKSNKLGNSQDLTFVKNVMRFNQEHRNKTYLISAGALFVSMLFVGIFVITTFY